MFRDILWPRWPRLAPRNYTPTERQWKRWRFWGRRLRTTSTFTLLKSIEAARRRAATEQQGSDPRHAWLLPYRFDLHNVYGGFHPRCNEGEVDAICCYMAYCPPEMIPLCVWLLGKCADRFRHYGLQQFRHHPSPQIRKHVAKALRRVEAWSLLDEMARAYPDDAKIQWFAKAPVTQRPFPERLSNYVRSVDDSHAGEVTTPSRMPFWSLEESWDYTPPKSVELIRRILRRIRHWVRWGVS
ncbi:MAG: hypothetical protein L0228_09500 [Planctomycetes bacterium]|nr:hypothetical protein [Planctomycetota bacterium]